jgi:hypothetical protein
MFFLASIHHILDKEFDLYALLFLELIGVQRRTLNNYKNQDFKLSKRQLSGLINKLDKRDLPAAVKRSVKMGLLLSFDPNSTLIDRSSILTATEAFEISVASDVDEIKPDNYLYYSMRFHDECLSPYLTTPFEITADNYDGLGFPYDQYDSKEVRNIINVLANPKDNSIKLAQRSKDILVDSIIGVLGALLMDIEELTTKLKLPDEPDVPSFMDDIWTTANLRAYFFEHLWRYHGFKTKQAFYEKLEKHFPIESESIDTNYDRWCRSGVCETKQWSRLAESLSVGSNYNDLYVLLRMRYIFFSVLELIKKAIVEENVEFTKDKLVVRLSDWLDHVKANFG